VLSQTHEKLKEKQQFLSNSFFFQEQIAPKHMNQFNLEGSLGWRKYNNIRQVKNPKKITHFHSRANTSNTAHAKGH
jgi:hypothetical protein